MGSISALLAQPCCELGLLSDSSASRAYIRLRKLDNTSGFGRPEPLVNFPGEQPVLLAKGFSLACDHSLTIADLADELAWDVAGVRRMLGAEQQRPILRLVPDVSLGAQDVQGS